MKSTIYIPKLIKVGFNPRNDTYTGMLGYIIYNDGKVWRKETSWEGWRYHYTDDAAYEVKKKEDYDDRVRRARESHASYVTSYEKNPKDSWYKEYATLTVEQLIQKQVGPYKKFQPSLGRISSDPAVMPRELDNDPIEGFVLNKKVGGNNYSWNPRQTYCRVYDPRGFEFEITIPNLLYILENTSSIKGKGLEGKFIYGWDGKDLVLVPESAPEYKEMLEFTELRGNKISKKELKVGGVYITENKDEYVYLDNNFTYNDGFKSSGKELWFYKRNDKYTKYTIMSVTSLKKYIGDDSDVANLLDGLDKEVTYKPKKHREVEFLPLSEYDLKRVAETDTYYPHTAYYTPSKRKGKFNLIYVGTSGSAYSSYNPKTYHIKTSTYGKVKDENVYKTFKELCDAVPLYKCVEKVVKKDLTLG